MAKYKFYIKNEPMKKFTFMIFFVLCGLFGINAQGTLDYASGYSSNVMYSQSNMMMFAADDTPKFTVSAKVLTAKNIDLGTVIDIYSVLGAKVHTFIYKGTGEVLNLNKGIYIIRAGTISQKIIL